MTHGVVLRRSARDALLWHFHVVLDSVPDGPHQREQFAERIGRTSRRGERKCEQALLRILAERPEGTLPKAVTSQMVAELQRILHPNLNEARVSRLREAIETELVNYMWRSRDKASQKQLADRIMYSVRNEGRLTFGDE
jgi:hypothetical protein